MSPWGYSQGIGGIFPLQAGEEVWDESLVPAGSFPIKSWLECSRPAQADVGQLEPYPGFCGIGGILAADQARGPCQGLGLAAPDPGFWDPRVGSDGIHG